MPCSPTVFKSGEHRQGKCIVKKSISPYLYSFSTRMFLWQLRGQWSLEMR